MSVHHVNWLGILAALGGIVAFLGGVWALLRGIFRAVTATEDNTAALKELAAKVEDNTQRIARLEGRRRR